MLFIADSASHSVCFGGGFRKLKLMQLACSSEGAEGNKYVGFAYVWRYHVIISHRSAGCLEDGRKIWHKVQGQQELAELYKQHKCTLDRFEFLVLYWG